MATFHERTFKTLLKLSEKAGGTPYLWDPKLKCIYITPISLRTFYMTGKLVAIATIFYGFQFIRLSTFSNRAWNDENILLAMFVSTSSFIMTGIPFYADPYEITSVLNSMYLTYVNFTNIRPSSRPTVSKRKLFEKVTLALTVNGILTSCNFILHCLLHADFAIYPYSLISVVMSSKLRDNVLFRVIMYVANALVCGRMQVGIAVGTSIYMGECLSLAYLCFTFLREFHMSSESQTDLKPFIVQYRTFELVFKLICKYFGVVLMPFLVIMTPGIVCINYTLIHHWNDDGMTLSVKAMLISFLLACEATGVIFLTLSGNFARNYNLTVLSWKRYHAPRRKDRLLLKKFAKSCKPMRFTNFTLGCKVRQETAGRYVVAVSKGTFRSVLTIGVA